MIKLVFETGYVGLLAAEGYRILRKAAGAECCTQSKRMRRKCFPQPERRNRL